MKKCLALLTVILAVTGAGGQSIPASQSRVAGRFVAYNYGLWNTYPASISPATGSQTFTVINSYVNLGDGRLISPYSTNAPLRIGTETVTPSAVANCFVNDVRLGVCQITATFTLSHTNSDKVSSATFGLQEALNDAGNSGGGPVTVDSAWANAGGTTAIVSAAIIPANTSIEDVRSGTSGGSGTVSGQTATCLPKASGATALTQASSVCDNGTTVTTPLPILASGVVSGTLPTGAAAASGHVCAWGDNVNAACFGLVGNGTADDTTAMQAAITYAVANHKNIYLPPAPAGGCYKVTLALNASNPGGNQATGFWMTGETASVNGGFVSTGYSTICHALTEAYPVIDFGGDLSGGLKNIGIIPVGGADSNSQATTAVYVSEGGVNAGTVFTLDNDALDAGSSSTTAGLVIQGADQTVCHNTHVHSQGTGIVVGGGLGGATAVQSKFYSGQILTNNTQYVLDGCAAGSSSTSPALYLSGAINYMFSGNDSMYSGGTMGIELNDATGGTDTLSGYGLRFEGQGATNQAAFWADTPMTGDVSMTLTVLNGAGNVGWGGPGDIETANLQILGGGGGPPTALSSTGSIINSRLTIGGSWGAFGTLSGANSKNSNIYSHGSSSATTILGLLSGTGICVYDESGNTHACTDLVAPNIASVNTGQLTTMARSGYTEQDAFGDSVTAGVGASSCTQPGGTCYVDRINTAAGSPTLHNFGTSSDQQCDITGKVFTNSNFGAASTALVTMMPGINDAFQYGIGGYEPTYNLCQNAAITWTTIPSTYKTMAAACTATGTWSADSTYADALGQKTTTNGDTLVCPYTTTAVGQTIVVWYRIIDGNGGQFSLVDDFNSAAITYGSNTTSQPVATRNGGTQSVGVLYLPYSTRTARSGNITVTNLSATSAGNIVSILGIGVIPPVGSSNTLFAGGVIPQLNDFNSQSTYIYDKDSQDNISYNQQLGLDVRWADVRTCIFGSPAEMAASPNQQLHPSNLGHQEIANCFLGYTRKTRKTEPRFKPTVWPQWNVLRTAATDFVSPTDDVVAENNASGVVVTLLPSAVFNTPAMLAGSAGSPFIKFIEIINFSATGSVTFTAGQGTTFLPNMNGLTLNPKNIVILQIFYQGPTTFYSFVSNSGGSFLSLTQSLPQAIQTGGTALTAAYTMAINGSTVDGWNFFGNNSSGNWTCSSLFGDNAGSINLGYCGTAVAIPSTTPTLKKTFTFVANTTNTGNTRLASITQANFGTGSNTYNLPDLGGSTANFIMGDGSAGTVGNVATYSAGAQLSHTGLAPSVAATGTLKSSISLPTGAATFTAGTNVSSCACASTFNCNNTRGRLTIVGGTATTGTICTVNFSATLSAAPFATVNEMGATTYHGLDHALPTTAGFAISAAVTVSGATVTVDYEVQP